MEGCNSDFHLLDEARASLMAVRRKRLLVLYYPPFSQISHRDMDSVYDELRSGGLIKEDPIDSLDLLLDTYGGDPSAAYAIAQCIRMFTKDLSVLVADHAFSAGTLLSFGGSRIRLGDGAALSPIDITLSSRKPGRDVELATVDAFMEFAKDCRRVLEELLDTYPGKTSDVESSVLVQMVKDIGALNVGKYYRERMLTGEYAQLLLKRYLFRDSPVRVQHVVNHFLLRTPTHDFHMDYTMCRERGLTVERMSTEESDKAKALVQALALLTEQNKICMFESERHRMPYIGYFTMAQQQERDDDDAESEQGTTGSTESIGHTETTPADVQEAITGSRPIRWPEPPRVN